MHTSYLEIYFRVQPIHPWAEILMAQLLELGFDSFTEEYDGILGYVPKAIFVEERLKELSVFRTDGVDISYTIEEMPNINWNAEWEKNFNPINIDDKVLIRAEFHPSQGMENEIIIQPKMSFGTGHHATTFLMIRQMLEMDFNGKDVLDMGCGTSVLAIFAMMKGAKSGHAIDIDPWSVENSYENAERNKVKLEIEEGTVETLKGRTYDIVLANINRNILINDIPFYSETLRRGGQLLLSGLCFFDVDDILDVCKDAGLKLLKKKEKEEWCSLLLEK